MGPAIEPPGFTDVSREAGILLEGYGHSVSIADFNKDDSNVASIEIQYAEGNVCTIKM